MEEHQHKIPVDTWDSEDEKAWIRQFRVSFAEPDLVVRVANCRSAQVILTIQHSTVSVHLLRPGVAEDKEGSGTEGGGRTGAEGDGRSWW